jgi:hypothetical protein
MTNSVLSPKIILDSDCVNVIINSMGHDRTQFLQYSHTEYC